MRRAALQANREYRARARFARHGHVATHHAGELAGDGSPSPVTKVQSVLPENVAAGILSQGRFSKPEGNEQETATLWSLCTYHEIGAFSLHFDAVGVPKSDLTDS